MIVSASDSYEHNTERVYAAFTTPEFYESKFTGVGARNVQIVDVSNNDGTFVITTQRDVPADVPGLLKKFLGEWNTIKQTETWQSYGDGEFGSELTVEAAGVPVQISGTMLLRPEGEGSVNDIELEIKCSVPLVGKSLAEFVAADSRKSLGEEYEFIVKYLHEGNEA